MSTLPTLQQVEIQYDRLDTDMMNRNPVLQHVEIQYDRLDTDRTKNALLQQISISWGLPQRLPNPIYNFAGI